MASRVFVKFSSNVTKEYYEVIRELISIILLLDGYKTAGEGSHKKLIEYLKSNYTAFSGYEISLIDNLRVVRNKIAYDGFFVTNDYIQRRLSHYHDIIGRLKEIIKEKMK